MLVSLLFLLQTPAFVDSVHPAPPPERIDLLALSCPRDGGDDIVVCGARDVKQPERLKPVPEKYVEGPLTFALPGGASVAPRAEQGRLNDSRAMIKLTIPF